MKVGKVELNDWMTPIVNGTPYYTWHRISSDYAERCASTHAYFSHKITSVFINCGGPGKFWPEFTGELKFLEDIYQQKEFASYEEAKEYVDIFLQKIDNLIIFT
jgi:hypothetical protein